jgi:hypothetical protein
VGTFFNPGDESFGLVGVSIEDETIVAATKGGDPAGFDFVAELSAITSFSENCELGGSSAPAHTRFCSDYHSLRQDGLTQAVLDQVEQHPSFQVVVTGHSHGAAIAHLLTLDLMLGHDIPVVFYSYGQPRTVGSEYAQRHFELLSQMPTAAYFRVTHNHDQIAQLPPCLADEDGVCIEDAIHPYHSGYQIHYPSSMYSHPTHCSTVDGFDCHVSSQSARDNDFYYALHVEDFCCPEEEAEGGYLILLSVFFFVVVGIVMVLFLFQDNLGSKFKYQRKV